MMYQYLIAAGWLFAATIARSSPVVTDFTKSADTITLEWTTPASSFIVEQSESLVDWADSVQISAISTGELASSVQFEIEEASSMFFRIEFGALLSPFPDPHFWQELLDVRPYTSGPLGTVYDIDFYGLEELQIRNQNITDCSGIEQLPDLRRVVLQSTPIDDLTPVASATNLTYLFLVRSPVSDLTPIASMPNLEFLGLRSTSVSDIRPLLSLPKLESLFIIETPLADLTSLSEFSNLKTLNIALDSIENADFLSGLTSLNELGLGGSYQESLQNISGLSGLTELRVLDLRYNNITDLTPLDTLTLLEELNLVGNEGVSDISCLSSMPELTRLSIAGTQVSDLSALGQLTNITWLYLPDNQISDLTPLITNASLGGLGEGDSVILRGNPLSLHAQTIQIPELRDTYNVEVDWP